MLAQNIPLVEDLGRGFSFSLQHVEFVGLESLPKISWSYQEFGRQGISLKYNYHLCAVPLKQRETVVASWTLLFSLSLISMLGLLRLPKTLDFGGFFFCVWLVFLGYYPGFFWCMILGKLSPFLCCCHFSLTATT